MTDYVTADWHLGHANIIKYCSRPFEDVEAMNWAIIRNMRETCKPGDRLWILGDLSMVPPHVTVQYLDYLRGIDLFLVLGNHDREPSRLTRPYFKWWGDYRRIKFQGRRGMNHAVLSHYPFESWHGMRKGAIHCFGHCHGKLARKMPNRYDVGVDVWDFHPVALDQLGDET